MILKGRVSKKVPKGSCSPCHVVLLKRSSPPSDSLQTNTRRRLRRFAYRKGTAYCLRRQITSAGPPTNRDEPPGSASGSRLSRSWHPGSKRRDGLRVDVFRRVNVIVYQRCLRADRISRQKRSGLFCRIRKETAPAREAACQYF
jgi:hypothetical protein